MSLLTPMDDSFTLANYEIALRTLTAKQYTFLHGKLSAADINSPGTKAIIRHDVDFLLNPVLPMARIEQSLGIRATYFFLSNAEKYNLRSDEGLETLEKLQQMGHRIGIHLDSKGIDDETKLQRGLEKELRYYQDLNIAPDTFSYHMPSPEILTINKFELFGLTNYYASPLFDNFKYLSDSNGYWRQNSLKTFLNESLGKNIYLLTHPIWWSAQDVPPSARLKNAFKQSEQQFTDWYEDVCKKYNRKFW